MGKLGSASICAGILALAADFPARAQPYANSYYAPVAPVYYPQPSAPAYYPQLSAPPVTKVDYNRTPDMPAGLYQSASGYKSPNAYSLAAPGPRRLAVGSNRREEDEDPAMKYYMSLGFAKTSFEGQGMMNGYEQYAMSNVSETMGNASNIGLGFGVVSKTGIRIEVGYSQLSGLGYGATHTSNKQWCPDERFLDDPTSAEYGQFFYDCSKTINAIGGSISSQNFGLGAYFPLDDLVGGIADGLVSFYVGGALGLAFNTVGDYTIHDGVGYGEAPRDVSGSLYVGGNYAAGFYEYDGIINHFGATTMNMSYQIELGATIEVSKKTKLDLYYRKSNYGKVGSKDEAFASYESVEILDPIPNGAGGFTCTPEAIAEGFGYFDETGWCELYTGLSDARLNGVAETGTIENTELGVKLRMIF